MSLYTGPWRTSIFLSVTSLLGGVFVGLSFLSSSGPHLGVIIGGLLWTAFFLWALGKEIARHWRDLGED